MPILTKICELDPTSAIDEDVLRLEVTMQDEAGVAESEAAKDLRHQNRAADLIISYRHASFAS